MEKKTSTLKTKFQTLPSRLRIQIYRKNSTSEALIKAMEASGGEIFSVCEEARDSIYIVAGNYRKQGDDTETLNSGWCGEPIKHNRIVNGISSVPNPCISLLWMVQNDIIDSIVAKNKGSFIGSGFLGRFLYCRGAPKTVPASKENIPLDEAAILNGKRFLRRLTKSARKACQYGLTPTKTPSSILGLRRIQHGTYERQTAHAGFFAWQGKGKRNQACGHFRACGRRGSNHSRHRKTRMQGCLVFNLRFGGFVFKRNAP